MRFRRKGILVGIVGMMCAITSVQATDREVQQVVRIGDVQITIVAPKGTCLLDRQNVNDESYFSTFEKMESANKRYLALFTTCKDLAMARERVGPSVSITGGVTVLAEYKPRNVSMNREEFVRDMCGLYSRRQAHAAELDLDYAFEKLAELLQSPYFQSYAFPGLHQSKTACFSGRYSQYDLPDGTEQQRLSVAGLTVLRGKIVRISRMFNDVGPEKFPELIDVTERTVAALVNANEN